MSPPALPPASDRLLQRYLWVLGFIDLLALAAVAMPEATMGAVHQRLGMGELPSAPVVGYLARSASLLYGLHGAMLIFVSFDLARYRPLIAFLAWAGIAHGALLVAIDLAEGMPWWWILLEGPLYGLMAAGVLFLLRRGRQALDASCPAGQEPVVSSGLSQTAKIRLRR